MTIKIENWRCCPSRPCRASWRTGLESSRSSSSPCSSSSSPWWSSPWSSSRDGEGQKQNVLNRKAWTYSSMFTQFRWLYHHLNHPILLSCQNFISLLLQDKDKNEYLLKASETYEPLNVNFVDLYQVRNWFTKPLPFHRSKNLIQTQAGSSSDSKGGLSSSFESGNKSSSSRAASSGNFLSLTFQNTQPRPYLSLPITSAALAPVLLILFWTLLGSQCISWDSTATISSNFPFCRPLIQPSSR